LAEFLKAAELIDVQVCVFDLSCVVHMNGYPRVAFYTGYGFDGDFLTHRFLLCSYLVHLCIDETDWTDQNRADRGRAYS
jgi:hypothetical protein